MDLESGQWANSNREDESLESMWFQAASAFEEICGESLSTGSIKNFEDVKKVIEAGDEKASFDALHNQGDRDRGFTPSARSLGMLTLKFLKPIVGAVMAGASVATNNSSAVNMTGNALAKAFDYPQAALDYEKAVNQVFGEVSSALSQFHIYQSIENIPPALTKQIHLVLVSFVKVCAHVVKYRQGGKKQRFFQKIKSIMDDDKGLVGEMDEFKRVLQQQRDIEGTITLRVAMESQLDIVKVLDKITAIGETTEEFTHFVQQTQQGVQTMKDDSERIKVLTKARNNLDLGEQMSLDGNTTEFVTKLARTVANGTGTWIWDNPSYKSWVNTASNKDNQLLFISGPLYSGKTLVSTLITKELEKHAVDRQYVAHYFFQKNADDEKNLLQAAISSMAFQLARVYAVQRQHLAKASEKPRSGDPTLKPEALWQKLIAVPPSSSGTIYYFVFDGIENLPTTEAEEFLKLIVSCYEKDGPSGRIRFLLSGSEERLDPIIAKTSSDALQIRVEDNNEADMQVYVREKLQECAILQTSNSDSKRALAAEKIIEKLPKKSSGSFSKLQYSLDEVIRDLNNGMGQEELDEVLDSSTKSHETAILRMEKSLTEEEVNELSELLKWVLHGGRDLTPDELEAVMFLYSKKESLASLETVIKTKYSAVLKLSDGCVVEQENIRDYLETRAKEKEAAALRGPASGSRGTISMSIILNNVDEHVAKQFFWDLAHTDMRGQLRTALNGGSSGTAFDHRISISEFDSRYTIIKQAFEYLSEENPKEQAKPIGKYLIEYLPVHLGRLFDLDSQDEGDLPKEDRIYIGNSLYDMLKDGAALKRHKDIFEQIWYTTNDLKQLNTWLGDSKAMSKVDPKWVKEMQQEKIPSKGYLKEFASTIVRGLLRERYWRAGGALDWIVEFIMLDNFFLVEIDPEKDNEPYQWWDGLSLSKWCRGVLEISEEDEDSLWFERLGEGFHALNWNSMAMYQKAVEKGSATWKCYQGLAEGIEDAEGDMLEAIAHIEHALKEVEERSAEANSKPEVETDQKPDSEHDTTKASLKASPKDIVDLYLLLGKYHRLAGHIDLSMKHYSIASEHDGAESNQAAWGYVGRMKLLPVLPVEGKTALLKEVMDMKQENSKTSTLQILRESARDGDRQQLLLLMLTAAKQINILPELLQLMEEARRPPWADEDGIAGVLMYYQGVGEYSYQGLAEFRGRRKMALNLWKNSHKHLAERDEVPEVRSAAAISLASAYFLGALNNDREDTEALVEISKQDIDKYGLDYLGALYSIQGNKEAAKAALTQDIRSGLQIISDDDPDNDYLGFSSIYRGLAQYQDFGNSSVALSLWGEPDLITKCLSTKLTVEIEESVGDDDRNKIIEHFTELGQEIIRKTKEKVPDAFMQVERVEAAIGLAKELFPPGEWPVEEEENDNKENENKNPAKVLSDEEAPAVEGDIKPAAAGEASPEKDVTLDATNEEMIVNGGAEESEVRDTSEQEGKEKVEQNKVDEKDEKAETLPSTATSARLVIRTRLQDIHKTHKNGLDRSFLKYTAFVCSGLKPDGTACTAQSLTTRLFYSCMFCRGQFFCHDCLKDLRGPTVEIGNISCGPNHRWLELPAPWSDSWLGWAGKVVRVPRVEPLEGEEKVFRAYYEGEGVGEEMPVEEWKQKMVDEWGPV